MINRLIGLIVSQQRLRLNPWKLPLTGLLLSVGLATQASMLVEAAPQLPDQSTSVATAQVPVLNASLPDGIYLYGQSSEPEQLGKEYIVFEARQGKLVGALYLPSSEYSCFSGTLDSKQMNLTVIDPYDQTAFSHTIARIQPTQIASAGRQINIQNTYDSITYPYAVGLEGYQPISQISDNDRQILNNCRESYQQKVGI